MNYCPNILTKILTIHSTTKKNRTFLCFLRKNDSLCTNLHYICKKIGNFAHALTQKPNFNL